MNTYCDFVKCPDCSLSIEVDVPLQMGGHSCLVFCASCRSHFAAFFVLNPEATVVRLESRKREGQP